MVTYWASLKSAQGSECLETFGPNLPLGDRWRSLYKPPIEKQTADLQERIIFTGPKLMHRWCGSPNPALTGHGRFCGQSETGTFVHTVWETGKLVRFVGFFLWIEALKSSMKTFLWETLLLELNIGLQFGEKKSCLSNCLIGTAKLAICKPRKSQGVEAGWTDPKAVLSGMTAEQLKMK